MNFIIKWMVKIIATASAKQIILQVAKELASRTDNTIDDNVVGIVEDIIVNENVNK
jgi:hypothetical protein